MLFLFHPNEAFKYRHLISNRRNIDSLQADWKPFGIITRTTADRQRPHLLHQVTNGDKEDTVVKSNYLIAVAVFFVAVVYDLYNMRDGVSFWAELRETMEAPLID